MSAPPSEMPSASKSAPSGTSNAVSTGESLLVTAASAEFFWVIVRLGRGGIGTTVSVVCASSVSSAFESASPSGVPTVCVFSSEGSSICGTNGPSKRRSRPALWNGMSANPVILATVTLPSSGTVSFKSTSLVATGSGEVLKSGYSPMPSRTSPGSASTTTRWTGSDASAQSIAARWASVCAASTNNLTATGWFPSKPARSGPT
jgi:hypothetical protein